MRPTAISRHDHLRSSSGASPLRVRRSDSSAHLLVWGSPVRTGSHLPLSGQMHVFHRRGARREWSNPPPVLSLTSSSMPERSMLDRKNLRTDPYLRSVIWV